MPSPVGHSLAAVALLQIAHRFRGVDTATTIALAVASNVPDLDYLPGILIGYPDRFHHHGTHSLLAAVLFGLVAGLLLHVPGRRSGIRVAGLTALAYASHLLLDMVATAGRPHYGVPLFWPWSEVRVNLPFDLFLGITRDLSATGFLSSLLTRHNLDTVVRELVLMGAVVAVLSLIDRRTTRRDPIRRQRDVGPGVGM